MKLSEKLRLLRIEKGKTQQEVSETLNIGITTLRNYENDKLDRMPNTYQLKQLKDYYDVTYEYLLDEECENKTLDTVDIGKKLHLSDKAIDIIKDLQFNSWNNKKENDFIKSQAFNYFLETFSDLPDFLLLLNNLEGNIQFYKEIIQFEQLNKLRVSFLYYIDTKNIEKLNELFLYYDEKLDNLMSLYQNGYVYNIEIDNDSLDDLKSNYFDFKELCTNFDAQDSRIEMLNVDMFDYLCEILEITIFLYTSILKEIGYLKYSISNIINNYLNNINNINIIDTYSFTKPYVENSLKNFLQSNSEIISKLSKEEKIKYNVPIENNN